MSSTPYLENYMDNLEYLPTDLQRNFNLMLELDCRAQTLLKEIDEKCDKLMSEISSDSLPNSDREKQILLIQSSFNLANEYGEDKVQLANQSYELVDKYIRKLDINLSRFKNEIEEKYNGEISGDNSADNCFDAVKKLMTSICAKNSLPAKLSNAIQPRVNRETIENGDNEKEKFFCDAANRSSTKMPFSPSKGKTHDPILHMAVDPNEPTYCLCSQVSYGEMIGCDNPDCSIEWFHFQCVGLNTKPKGKWFCPNCK